MSAPLPSDIAGLVLWLKADAITGLADNAAVASWADSSGLGNNAAQGTGASQPTYQTNEIGGKPVVRFDGANDYLLTGALAVGNSFTVFVVMRRQGAPTGDHRVLVHGTNFTTVGTQYWQLLAASGGNTIFDHATAGLDVNSGSAWGTSTVLDTLLKDNSGAGLSRYYRNAVLLGSGAGTQVVATQPLFIGGWNGLHANVDVAELIVYNTALSSANRETIERYLTMKYILTGVRLTLPNYWAYRTPVTRKKEAYVWRPAYGPSQSRTAGGATASYHEWELRNDDSYVKEFEELRALWDYLHPGRKFDLVDPVLGERRTYETDSELSYEYNSNVSVSWSCRVKEAYPYAVSAA